MEIRHKLLFYHFLGDKVRKYFLMTMRMYSSNKNGGVPLPFLQDNIDLKDWERERPRSHKVVLTRKTRT